MIFSCFDLLYAQLVMILIFMVETPADLCSVVMLLSALYPRNRYIMVFC